MRVKESMLNNVVRGLSQSMTQKEMIHLARRIVPEYNLHERMGMSPKNAIPHGDGAKQIVRDMREWNYFTDFIALMAKAETTGFHGKKYQFAKLGHVINHMAEEGIIYNSQMGSFIEDSRKSITKNWGVIREGHLSTFTLLKLDLVKNTEMVRDNDQAMVERIFSLIRQDILEIVQLRLGRAWSWEGDGGIFAFYYGSRNEQAVYSAMEILHRIFLFNHFTNRLDRPIQLRQAIMTGPVEFSMEEGNIMVSETVKNVTALEENHTDSDSITISQEVYSHLHEDVVRGFDTIKVPRKQNLYNYRLRWEQ